MQYNQMNDYHRLDLMGLLRSSLAGIKVNKNHNVIGECLRYLDIRSDMPNECRDHYEVSFSIWCLDYEKQSILLEQKEGVPYWVPLRLNEEFRENLNLEHNLRYELEKFGRVRKVQIHDVGAYYVSSPTEEDEDSSTNDTICFDIRFLMESSATAPENGLWLQVDRLTGKNPEIDNLIPESIMKKIKGT